MDIELGIAIATVYGGMYTSIMAGVCWLIWLIIFVLCGWCAFCTVGRVLAVLESVVQLRWDNEDTVVLTEMLSLAWATYSLSTLLF